MGGIARRGVTAESWMAYRIYVIIFILLFSVPTCDYILPVDKIMTLFDPDPDNEHGQNDDSFGRINGLWFYIKSFFCNPHTIFTRRKKPKRVNFEFEEERPKL